MSWSKGFARLWVAVSVLWVAVVVVFSLENLPSADRIEAMQKYDLPAERTYLITAPDGKKYRVSGVSHEDALATLKEMLARSDATPSYTEEEYLAKAQRAEAAGDPEAAARLRAAADSVRQTDAPSYSPQEYLQAAEKAKAASDIDAYERLMAAAAAELQQTNPYLKSFDGNIMYLSDLRVMFKRAEAVGNVAEVAELKPFADNAEAELDQQVWERASAMFWVAVIPPAILLALMLGVGWVIRGFRRA